MQTEDSFPNVLICIILFVTGYQILISRMGHMTEHARTEEVKEDIGATRCTAQGFCGKIPYLEINVDKQKRKELKTDNFP